MTELRATPSLCSQAEAVAVAKALIALQSGRRALALPSLFADPAWDMLLDLFVARAEGRPVAVSSLCIASGVPASTAHRWIQALVDHDAVRRRADPVDRRRVFIEITEPAFAAMASELVRHRARMQRIGG
jgi:hypothetical protein